MNTTLLNQAAPLGAAPALPPWLAWVRVLWHHTHAFLLPRWEPLQQLSHRISSLATPFRSSSQGIYTPLESWDGYR
jgi:hypothetical protein